MVPSLARRSAGLPLLLSVVGVLALTPASAPAASGDIKHVCANGTNAQRVISTVGAQATCATGVPLMKAWRRGGKPKRYRGHTCGEVKATKIGFHDDKRWFATWKCSSGRATYLLWTRY